SFQIRTTAALCQQESSGPQSPKQIGKQPVVIFDPVKDGSRENHVEVLLGCKVEKIELLYLHALSKIGQAVARLLHHISGSIYGHNMSFGKSIQKFGGHPATATAGVQNALIASERKILEFF